MCFLDIFDWGLGPLKPSLGDKVSVGKIGDGTFLLIRLKKLESQINLRGLKFLLRFFPQNSENKIQILTFFLDGQHPTLFFFTIPTPKRTFSESITTVYKSWITFTGHYAVFSHLNQLWEFITFIRMDVQINYDWCFVFYLKVHCRVRPALGAVRGQIFPLPRDAPGYSTPRLHPVQLPLRPRSRGVGHGGDVVTEGGTQRSVYPVSLIPLQALICDHWKYLYLTDLLKCTKLRWVFMC